MGSGSDFQRVSSYTGSEQHRLPTQSRSGCVYKTVNFLVKLLFFYFKLYTNFRQFCHISRILRMSRQMSRTSNKNLADARMADRLGQFYLWLKVGLYLPIENEISRSHNSPSEGGGPLLGWWLMLSSGRYLSKMIESRQTVCRRSTHFDKIGPQGAL